RSHSEKGLHSHGRAEWRRLPPDSSNNALRAGRCVKPDGGAPHLERPAESARRRRCRKTRSCLPDSERETTDEPRRWEIQALVCSRLFQLAVDGFGIIGECGLVFRILAEIAVLLHVNLTPELLHGRAALVQALHLRIQIAQVIAKTL